MNSFTIPKLGDYVQVRDSYRGTIIRVNYEVMWVQVQFKDGTLGTFPFCFLTVDN